jgi:hypothetical protein
MLFAEALMAANGTSRRLATLHQFNHFRSEADIPQAALIPPDLRICA